MKTGPVSSAFLICLILLLHCLPAAAGPGETFPAPAGNRVDDFVREMLRREGATPSGPASDEVFLRRAYLDVTGTIPLPAEAAAFLESRLPDKRARLIDQLLESPEFADYQALRWCDILRVKSEFPGNLWPNAVQAYHQWVRSAFRENMPYDRFARLLLTSSGSNFRDPPVNFYRVVPGRDPGDIASFAALVFMGVRLRSLSPGERAALAVFFSRLGFKATGEWKEEIVFHDRWKDGPGADSLPEKVNLPGGPVRLAPGQDPRVAFADWLIRPENPWFARHAVNRAWFWLMGRGLVHEPDDFRADNPPRDAALLEWLAGELVAHDWDMKHVYRLILNSAAWQMSAEPAGPGADAFAPFARALPRRLDAEVLIDAVGRITATGEQYESRIPEPFTFIPPANRTVNLADGSIDSAFLVIFGRPSRDTGLLSERSNSLSVTQRMHFLNSTHIQDKIYGPQFLKRLAGRAGDDGQLVSRVYLAVLSRFPTPGEDRVAREYLAASGNREAAVGDLVWALLNTAEFMFRH